MKTTKTKAKPSANKTKRSRNGTGHVRLRADGRWEGQYYFEGERKSCYGQTEEECQGKLNVVLGKIYRGTYVDGSMMPFYTYMHFWHEKYILVRPATHTNYETYIEKHIYHSKLDVYKRQPYSFHSYKQRKSRNRKTTPACHSLVEMLSHRMRRLDSSCSFFNCNSSSSIFS